MTLNVKPYPGVFKKVTTGGVPVVALFGDHQGALLMNPASAADQGLVTAETLYFSYHGDAKLGASGATFGLQPGETWHFDASTDANISVNAATSGHKFSVLLLQPAPMTPTAQPGNFPPNAVTTKTTTIPSYLYKEYDDDEDLQAFVESYNTLTQVYVDAFNALNLPIYTNDAINSYLLDWVGAGLYGYPRPVVSSGSERLVGPVNTFMPNVLTANEAHVLLNEAEIIDTDDIYKRCLTWHLYRGDGKAFDVRWLKRRIARWLFGSNGVDDGAETTYQISVSFGVGTQVNITLLHSAVTNVAGAIPNMTTPNQFQPNQINLNVIALTPLPNAAIWKEAVESGALELPFQYDYVIEI